MKTMSYTETRANFAQALDAVADDREELIITRAGHEPAVLLSLADYEALRETAYLLRSPANARHLFDSIASIEAGRGEIHELVEE
ncbi:MAG: type II toxin-antitoxin system prevent-host-death family antitoxin [Corynebacterium sp.]|nr:type II toxin-antitoxin system prevent-host-death family antitoxin [Corynebacterium sp.]